MNHGRPPVRPLLFGFSRRRALTEATSQVEAFRSDINNPATSARLGYYRSELGWQQDLSHLRSHNLARELEMDASKPQRGVRSGYSKAWTSCAANPYNAAVD